MQQYSCEAFCPPQEFLASPADSLASPEDDEDEDDLPSNQDDDPNTQVRPEPFFLLSTDPPPPPLPLDSLTSTHSGRAVQVSSKYSVDSCPSLYTLPWLSLFTLLVVYNGDFSFRCQAHTLSFCLSVPLRGTFITSVYVWCLSSCFRRLSLSICNFISCWCLSMHLRYLCLLVMTFSASLFLPLSLVVFPSI